MNPLVRSLHLASLSTRKPVQTHTAAAQADGRLEEYFKIAKKRQQKENKNFLLSSSLSFFQKFLFPEMAKNNLHKMLWNF